MDCTGKDLEEDTRLEENTESMPPADIQDLVDSLSPYTPRSTEGSAIDFDHVTWREDTELVTSEGSVKRARVETVSIRTENSNSTLLEVASYTQGVSEVSITQVSHGVITQDAWISGFLENFNKVSKQLNYD